MPKASKLKPAPLPPSDEAAGQRRARIGREGGIARIELAGKTGIARALVPDYERGKLRLDAGTIFRFAAALGVATDEWPARS